MMGQAVEQQLTHQKSLELAHWIKLIGQIIPLIDIDYAEKMVIEMIQQSSRQESMSVVNPVYNFRKGDLLREQAKALNCLVQYIKTLQQCDEIKAMIKEADAQRSEISKLFL